MLGLFYKKGQKNPRKDFNAKTDLPPFRVNNIEKLVENLKDFSLPDKLQPIPICKLLFNFIYILNYFVSLLSFK